MNNVFKNTLHSFEICANRIMCVLWCILLKSAHREPTLSYQIVLVLSLFLL